jgi:hypothetical protein
MMQKQHMKLFVNEKIMKKSSLFLFALLLGFLEINAQNLKGFSAKILQVVPNAEKDMSNFYGISCDPDSILGYGFITPTDSVLGQRKIFKKYGNTAKTIYTYDIINGAPLQLYSVDSTTLNAAGQPIYNELWEFNEDSSAIVFEERLFCYPHDGSVQKDYFFPEYILNIIDPNSHDNVAFDSVILHKKSFFTGLMEPVEKTVNMYTTSGQLEEVHLFDWDAFGSMDWFPTSRMKYFYTPSGRTDHVEEYDWNGIEFILKGNTQYTYNSSDSLILALSTNVQTGMPSDKLELVYDAASKSTTAIFYTWDTNGQQWVLGLNLLGEFDTENRLEKIEFVSNFLGTTDGFRYEYIYLGNSTCPWYAKIYELESGGNWGFIGKFYYFPNMFTSTHEYEVPKWAVYPNPSNGDIWVTAPIGTNLRITNMQGVELFRGVSIGDKQFIDLLVPPHQAVLTLSNENWSSSQLIVFLR